MSQLCKKRMNFYDVRFMMKCPKCDSRDYRKFVISDPSWKSGRQYCNDCGFQGDWALFCEAPTFCYDDYSNDDDVNCDDE